MAHQSTSACLLSTRSSRAIPQCEMHKQQDLQVRIVESPSLTQVERAPRVEQGQD